MAPPSPYPPCDVRDCPNPGTAIVGWHYVCPDHIAPPPAVAEPASVYVDATNAWRHGSSTPSAPSSDVMVSLRWDGDWHLYRLSRQETIRLADMLRLLTDSHD